MTDDLVDRLRALPPRQPEQPEQSDRFEQVRGRVRRRRRVRAGVAGLGVLVVLLVAVPVSLAARTTPAPRVPPVPVPPVATAAVPVTCPKVFGGHVPWVPARPVGVDTKGQLVPSQAPAIAVVCLYRESAAGSRNLTGQRRLTGGLDQLAAELSWLPRKFPGQDHPCYARAILPIEDFLMGLSYPGGGTVWVSTGRECVDTSNGSYTTQASLGSQVGASYEAGAWVHAPLSNVPSPDPCATPLSGRRGEETALVPAQPVSVIVCEQGSQQGATYRSWAVPSGFEPLVAALNALPIKPSSWSCNSLVPGTRSAMYELKFHYATGPDVFVRIMPGCRPAVDNYVVAADDASTVVPLVQQLIAGAGGAAG